jgi:hypothetical protein
MPKKKPSTTTTTATAKAKSAAKPAATKNTPPSKSKAKVTAPKKKSAGAGVKRAMEQASVTDSQPAYESVTVKLTASQVEKLQDLSNTLIVADRLLFNLAIRYAVAYAVKKKQPLEKLEGFPKRFGNAPHEIELTADTVMKLSDHNFTDKAKELAVVGLKLLHERLM